MTVKSLPLKPEDLALRRRRGAQDMTKVALSGAEGQLGRILRLKLTRAGRRPSLRRPPPVGAASSRGGPNARRFA